jgi:cytoskeletal protein CcmA (bactofilin family)
MLNAKGSKNVPTGGSLNTIGTDTIINGDIKAKGDLRIDGSVKGHVNSSALVVIGPNAVIDGNVEGDNVIVEGIVNGNISVSNELNLKSNARIQGDILMSRLIVENGAIFNGKSQMNASSNASKGVEHEAK